MVVHVGINNIDESVYFFIGHTFYIAYFVHFEMTHFLAVIMKTFMLLNEARTCEPDKRACAAAGSLGLV